MGEAVQLLRLRATFHTLERLRITLTANGKRLNTVHFLFCRTVEVNNTDAEGRLVLGDGVRYCFFAFELQLRVVTTKMTICPDKLSIGR